MTNETLGLEATREGHVAFLRATGQLDLATVSDFRDAARDARDGASELVVDLCRLEFIDSTGLTALLDIRHAMAAEGIGFRVDVDAGPVRDAIENTGLRELLRV